MLDHARPATAPLVERCEALFSDLNFEAARAWKAAAPGRKVIGFMPYYVPREVIHAAGCLPLGVLGGGDQLEVIHGDAYYQSYICRIPRSTIELGVSGRLDFVDGMLFPSICDVIRNLSGMWKLMFPNVGARYVDLPQNFDDELGGKFYRSEINEMRHWLSEITGRPASDDALRASIALFNENRRLVREVYAYRARKPWNAPSAEDHNRMLSDYLVAADSQERPLKDNSRIVLSGAFCEQPPLNLVKSIELAGCYIVDDDFMLVNRWEKSDVAVEGDPVANLAHAYLHNSNSTSAKFEPNAKIKGQFLVDAVRASNAEGVIFAMPSFCDPALLDRPMLQNALKAANIPSIAFKYAENSGQMQPVREQAGTFADSIKLWSAS